MRSFAFASLVLLTALVAVLPAHANPWRMPPPFTVYFERGDTMYIYECYPANAANGWMTIMLQYPEGTAFYPCDLSQTVIREPPPVPDVGAHIVALPDLTF